MSAVLQGQIGAADATDTRARVGKFVGMPGAFRSSVVAGRDDLAIADDDAADSSREAGGTQRRREGEDHGVGGLVRPALLVGGVRLDGVSVGRSPAGAPCRWPGGPGGHAWMLPRTISQPV